MTESIFNATNYIVPASGTTRCFKLTRNFVADQAVTVDFRTVGIDGVPFRPSGVFVDNSKGSAALTVVINELGFSLVVGPGEFLMSPYPAPMQQSATITGDGDAVVLFVDFPVIPYSSASGGNVQILFDILTGVEGLATMSGASLTLLGNISGDTSALSAKMSSALSSLDTISGNTGATDGKMGTLISQMDGVLVGLGDIHGVAVANRNNTASVYEALYGYDSTGALLPYDFNSLPRTLNYDGSNNLTSEVVARGAKTYTKTYSYTGANLTSISAWVKS